MKYFNVSVDAFVSNGLAFVSFKHKKAMAKNNFLKRSIFECLMKRLFANTMFMQNPMTKIKRLHTTIGIMTPF